MVVEERGDEEGLIVQRDSTILSRSMTKEQTKKGVVYTDLETALRLDPDLVRRYFAQQVRPERTLLHDNGLYELSPALCDIGPQLLLPRLVQIP